MIEEVDRDGLLYVVGFDVGDSVVLGSSFGFEFAEARLDSGEDGATGIVLGFEGADEAILTIGDVVDRSAKRFKLCGSIGVGLMIDGAKVGGKQGTSIGPEDALGEELGDGGEKRVFSDPDAGGVVEKTLGDLARVVERRLTDVVRTVLVETAVHAPPARLTDHERTQKKTASAGWPTTIFSPTRPPCRGCWGCWG